MKKPTSVIRRRAWVFLFDLSGRLVQAMAVRRHGCPMMMVVAVMAEGLHLHLKLKAGQLCCQINSFALPHAASATQM
jgi:hypothetical protein